MSRHVLFLNDTSRSSNPGCRAVMATLRTVYGATADSVAVRSLPVGTWADPFRDLAPRGSEVVDRTPGRYWAGRDQAPPLDVDAWRERASALAERDVLVADALEWADLVVANGEGSLHHNSSHALGLLALCRAAMQRGKLVDLVNATVQAMERRVLLDVLPGLSFFHVREPLSRTAMQTLGLDPAMTGDVAFAARFMPGTPREWPVGVDRARACLLTSGVLSPAAAIAEQAALISRSGLSPVYLVIGDGGERAGVDKVAEETGLPIIDARTLDWTAMLDFLRQFPVAVSGRHHINAFLMLAGVPFVPLRSNTWKIDATLQMLNYPLAPVANAQELHSALWRVMDQRAEWAAAAARAGRAGLALSQQFRATEPVCV